MKKLSTIFILFATSFILFAQTTNDVTKDKIDRAKLVYRNLEYNTVPFNDLKQVWNITDPQFIRLIFSKFVNENALTKEGLKIDKDELTDKVQDLYDGKVFIELRKRYYDDEIEKLRFFTENKTRTTSITEVRATGDTVDVIKKDYFFDAIEDHIFIKDVLGNEIYTSLIEKFYSHTDLSKTAYSTEVSYNYDIVLHLLDPSLMFYTLTTSAKNKYLISLFGRWGNDHLSFPGWFSQDYYAGVSLTYIDKLVQTESYNTYTLDLGFGNDAKQPNFEFSKDEYGKRLFRTGYNLYFRLTGSPLKLWLPQLEKLHLKLEGSFSLSKFSAQEYSISHISKFYSIRNYFVFYVEYKDIVKLLDFGWLNAGLGFSTHDIKHYYLDPEQTQLNELTTSGAVGFQHTIVTDVSLANHGGLLQHNIGVNLNYQVLDSYGYIGLKTRIMLSNTIGFDFKYFKSFKAGNKDLPFYRLDSYLVFSPIIRINY